jgi:Protein of unknown function (DUF1236)
MRRALRNSFLVTTAAAALVTGITIASAQGPGGGGSIGGGGGGGAERHQGPSGGGGGVERHQGPSGGGRAESLGSQGRSSGQLGETREQRGHAYGEERGKALGEQKTNKQLGTKERNEQLGRGERNERLGTTREERSERFGRSERNERLGTSQTERGPGFAREHTGRSVELSTEQRTRIHDVFTRDRDRFNRFRVSRVDFDLRPGVRIPRHFHLFPLPLFLVDVVPEYRDYRFFYYGDEIVIVDPVTLEIVAVIPA